MGSETCDVASAICFQIINKGFRNLTQNKALIKMDHEVEKMKDSTEKIDSEIESIAQKIITEIETASSKEIADAKYVKKILHLSDLHHTSKLFGEIEQVTNGSVCTTEKKAVIKALLLSTWMQRLYFIIRSFLMALFGSVITFFYIMYFGTINIYQGILLGVLIFTLTLIITRFFDVEIIKATKKIVQWLGYHPEIRDFIMNHF